MTTAEMVTSSEMEMEALASLEAEPEENPPCFAAMYEETAAECGGCGWKEECAAAAPKVAAIEPAIAEAAAAEEEAKEALKAEKEEAAVEKEKAKAKAAAAPKAKKAPKVPKTPKEPRPFKPLVKIREEGILQEGKYLKVGGELYKSGIYKLKNLESFETTGLPFPAGSKFADAFEVLRDSVEGVSSNEVFTALKAKHPDAKDISLKTVASDVLNGALFFGIVQVVKEGRSKAFKLYKAE